LEAEKLDDPEVDRRMEAQAALVRAESAVEADTEPAVDVHLAAVVLPRHAEDDLPLGLADPLDDLVLRVLRVFAQDRRKRRGYLRNCLKELAFAGISALDVLNDPLDSRLDFSHFPWPRRACRAGHCKGKNGEPAQPDERRAVPSYARPA